MAANTTPIFTLTPVIPVVQIATANTNRDGTGTMGTLLTGATDGTRVDAIKIKATGTTTAGTIRLFYYDGTNVRLIAEFPVNAITVSATVPAFEATIPMDIIVPSAKELRVSTEKAETFNVFALGGAF
ncbi:MAG TPA: hypothetical protein DEH78_14305 [Solibacterales bacterium]|nr:hypothetical protein [Bryobacterales bacterium]